MAKSKVDKSRQEKVKQFKNKQKKMSEQATNQNPNIPQLPPVRSFPTWGPDAEIKVNGRIWEVINNGLSAIQEAQQAAQSVLTENILNGTMKMDFEKLNPETLEYVPMTDEEKEPHMKEFEKAVEMIKNRNKPTEKPDPSPVVEEEKTESVTVEKLETDKDTPEVNESK